MQTLNANDAVAFLQNVKEDHHSFWFNHGVIAKNLTELAVALDDMNDLEFAYHVNDGRNDIATWVAAVIGDQTLATKLQLLSTLDATRRMVARRVEELTAALPAVKTVEEAAAGHDVAIAKAVVAPREPEMAMAAPKAPAAKKAGAKKTTARKTVAKKAAAPAPTPVKKQSLINRLLKR